MPESNDVLQKILEDAHLARLSGRRTLAIFDLDSTLFDLTPRIRRILEHFAADPKMQIKYPEACALIPDLHYKPRDWGIHEPLERAGLKEAQNPEFYKDIHDHWVNGFFSNDHLHEDQPLPGAVEFVQALEAEEAHIMYLTGRDIARMHTGTVASLKQWNFPLDQEHVRLILKPEAGMDDAQFKLDIITQAKADYFHVWLFENEPVNLNLVQKHLPDVRLVFIDTTHSGRENVPPELDRIPHFETDLEEFAAFCQRRGRSNPK